MTSEEKSAWIMGIVTIISYAVYVVIVLGRVAGTSLTAVDYGGPLVWTIGAAILGNIVLRVFADIGSPKAKKDDRDRQIYRFGESMGASFIVIGAVAAMLMALAEWNYFWIANVIYLGFVLSAILSSLARVLAYRRGFSW